MGETGCGKTRLIRYMCDLARQKRHLRNMLILKVSIMFRVKYLAASSAENLAGSCILSMYSVTHNECQLTIFHILSITH